MKTALNEQSKIIVIRNLNYYNFISVEKSFFKYHYELYQFPLSIKETS